MGDSSSDESETQFQLYKDRKEWKDITPVNQDDGEQPIVAIDYSEQCNGLIFLQIVR